MNLQTEQSEPVIFQTYFFYTYEDGFFQNFFGWLVAQANTCVLSKHASVHTSPISWTIVFLYILFISFLFLLIQFHEDINRLKAIIHFSFFIKAFRKLVWECTSVHWLVIPINEMNHHDDDEQIWFQQIVFSCLYSFLFQWNWNKKPTDFDLLY